MNREIISIYKQMLEVKFTPQFEQLDCVLHLLYFIFYNIYMPIEYLLQKPDQFLSLSSINSNHL